MHQRSLVRRVARRKSGLFRLDHHQVFVGRDDAHRAAAARAGLNADAEHALQALCSRQQAWANRWSVL